VIKIVTEYGQDLAAGKFAVHDRLPELLLRFGFGLALRLFLSLAFFLLFAPLISLPLFLFPLSLRLTG
jgi:hypothetical protein